MVDISDYIQHNRVLYGATGEWVQFKSRSDALIASLVLHHNISLQALEPVFELLCDNKEYDASDCSFSKPTDVHVALAAQRANAALERANAKPCSGDFEIIAGFPNPDIFDEVVRILAAERRWHVERSCRLSYGIFDEIHDDEPSSPQMASATSVLYNMSLVHRTWTFDAQKALRRCSVIENEFRSMKTSVRALTCPTLAFADTIVYDASQTELDDNAIVLLKAIILYPYHWALEKLALKLVLGLHDYNQQERNTRTLPAAVDCLASLTELGVLSVEFKSRSSPHEKKERNTFLVSLCQALTRMKSLKTFSLSEETQDLYPHAVSIELPTQVSDKHPTRTLKKINVAIADPQVVSWLTCPRADYRPDRVSLDLTDSFRETYGRFLVGMSSNLEPSVGTLQSLSLQAGFYTTTHQLCSAGLVEKAIAVEDLVLRFDAQGPEAFQSMVVDMNDILKTVSSSTKRLCLLFHLPFRMNDTSFSECMQKLDTVVSWVVPKLARLSKLAVIVDRGSFGGRNAVAGLRNNIPSLHRTCELCTSRCISFLSRAKRIDRCQFA